jgi:uncharacterized protein YbaP (TraB family)
MTLRSTSARLAQLLVLIPLVLAPLLAGASSTPAAWRVEGPAGTAYLLGSLHYGTEELYPLPSAVEDAFRNSDALVVEVNILDLDPVRAARTMAQHGFYQDGSTVEQNISPSTWREVRQLIRDYGLPLEIYQIQKPWLLAVGLSTLELGKLGYREDLGIDQHFLRRAQGAKPIVELETLDSQIGIFDQLSAGEQEQLLVQTLDELGDSGEYFGGLFDAWKRGDADAIEEIISATQGQTAAGDRLYYRLFTKRNKEMASKIGGMLDDNKTYFVVLGAGHLVGDGGIVELLRGKGFELTQL